MRQRQAAAAANWAMQQERLHAQQASLSSQRLGSAILRLLNFSEQLNSFADSASLAAWRKFVDDFYVDPALCTHSLPIKPDLSYELPTPLLPAYFYRLHREVSKFALTFHDAREYYLAPASHVVECPKATFCYYFPNATKIEMLGKLRVVFSPGQLPNSALKIESWEFVGETWDEWVCRNPPPPNKMQSNDGVFNDDLAISQTDQEASKDTSADKPAEEEEQNSDDDHEDLFGRSPSGSAAPVSRPASRTANKKDNSIDEQTPDLNKRTRMVCESGITATHMRLLEISDVLGQLSPLFGKKSPQETLASLLKSLPDLPVEAENARNAPTTNEEPKTQASQSDDSTENQDTQPRDQATSAIPSGKAMRLQAAQVLQKQAAQTLSQALPPSNFDFHDFEVSDEGPGDLDDEDPMPETDEYFGSPEAPPATNGTGNVSNTVEDSEEIHIKLENNDTGTDDLGVGEFDVDLNLSEGLEHKSDSEDMFGDDNDEPAMIGTKREGEDDAFGRSKRMRTDDADEEETVEP